MLGKILGLDINEDFIAAVEVAGGLHGYQITACASVPLAKASDIDEALATIFEQINPKGAVCLSSIPAGRFSYRQLAMPFKDKKKIRQTVVFELEPMLAAAIDELLIDFTVVDQSADHTNILAASVSREFLAAHLAFLRSQNFEPVVLEIRDAPLVGCLLKRPATADNGLLLDVGSDKCTLALFLNRRIALIRDLPMVGSDIVSASTARDVDNAVAEKERVAFRLESFCKAAQNTIRSFAAESGKLIPLEKVYITGCGAAGSEVVNSVGRFFNVPAEMVDLRRSANVQIGKEMTGDWQPAFMDNALALALRGGKSGRGFNFRREEFAATGQYFRLKKEIRTALVFIMVFLSLIIVDFGVDYHALRDHYYALDQQLTAVFTKTFPDVKRIVDPVQQMRVKIKELKKAAISLPTGGVNRNILDLLAEISRRIPPKLAVHVARMTIDQEEVHIKGKTDTFNTVDSIKKNLAASAFFKGVAISSANLARSGEGVQFELRLQRRQ